MRVDYANMVQTIDIDINDSVWPWPLNSNKENDGFTIERLSTREMPYNNLMMNAVTYEMSWDRHLHTRRVISLLDRLSAIGGLFGALTPIFACMVGLF